MKVITFTYHKCDDISCCEELDLNSYVVSQFLQEKLQALAFICLACLAEGTYILALNPTALRPRRDPNGPLTLRYTLILKAGVELLA